MAPPSDSAAPSLPQGPERLRILAADDCRVSRLILGAYLGGPGLHLELVESGMAALERAGHDGVMAYGLILLDLSMPGMDGSRAAELLRRTPRGSGARFVAITAASAAQMTPERLGGFDAWLQKPVDRQALGAEVSLAQAAWAATSRTKTGAAGSDRSGANL